MEDTPHSDITLLVVEDSRTQAEYLQHILEKEGYRVLIAFDGRQAMEMIRSDHPSLILTDIIMPEMDGYALCSAVKGDPELADIPVILVTQLFDPPDLIKGLEAGANDIIIKPFEPEHVLSRITGTLMARAGPSAPATSPALALSFGGRVHVIPENNLRTPSIILSSYDVAIRKNAELEEACQQVASENTNLRQTIEKLQEANRNLQASLDPGRRDQISKIIESEERYRMITELSPFPISIIDTGGRFQYVNRKFEQVFGFTLGTVPSLRDWLPDGQLTDTPLQTADRVGTADPACPAWDETVPRIYPVTCRDGSLRQIRLCPVILASGDTFVIFEDLTHKAESERLRSILVSIVNSSNDAIIGKSLDGIILSWNKAAERYYGYLAEEVIGKSVDLIVPQDLREQLGLFLRRVGSGETIERFDTVRLRKDGTRIGVCVTLSPIRNDENQIIGICTIAQNILEREKAEAGRIFRQQVLHHR